MQIIRRTMVYLNKHNFNLLYRDLVRSHLEYGNVVWSPFLKSDITLTENAQRRASRYVPDINKLKYQERREAMNLATLTLRKNVEIFWSVFSLIQTEYGDLRCKSLYSIQMRENTDQKNSEYGYFSFSVKYRRFHADMIETYKITHGYFEGNCFKHLFQIWNYNTNILYMFVS